MVSKIPENTRGLLMNRRTLDALVSELPQAKGGIFCAHAPFARVHTEQRIDLHISPHMDDGQIVPLDRDGKPNGAPFGIKIESEVARWDG